MSRASIKASSLYSEAKMTDTTRVKFDVPIGTWGQTQIEVEYPWHRDLDSIILPLLEKAHEQQAERQRKHRAEAQPDRKSSRRTKNTTIAERTDRADRAEQQQQQTTLPMRPNEDIKLFLKGFESRLELFHKGKHVSRSMTPDTVSSHIIKKHFTFCFFFHFLFCFFVRKTDLTPQLGLEDGAKLQVYELIR